MINFAFALHLQGLLFRYFSFFHIPCTKCATGNSLSRVQFLELRFCNRNKFMWTQFWLLQYGVSPPCSGSVEFEGALNVPTAHSTQPPNYYMNHAFALLAVFGFCMNKVPRLHTHTYRQKNEFEINLYSKRSLAILSIDITVLYLCKLSFSTSPSSPSVSLFALFFSIVFKNTNK